MVAVPIIIFHFLNFNAFAVFCSIYLYDIHDKTIVKMSRIK